MCFICFIYFVLVRSYLFITSFHSKHYKTQHCRLLTGLFQIKELNLGVVLNFVMKHDKELNTEKQQFPGFTCMHNDWGSKIQFLALAAVHLHTSSKSVGLLDVMQ